MQHTRRNITYLSFMLLILLPSLKVFAFIQPNEKPIPIYWFDWSQDGNRIAIATGEGVSIYDSAFRLLTFRPQPDPTRARSFARLSPNGTLLATEDEIWDANTLKTLFQLKTAYVLGEWNQDGTLISAVAPDTKGIVIYDTATGNLVKTISTGDITLGFNPLWNPDGTHFAATDIRKTLIIIDFSRGEIVARYPHEDILSNVAWSHTGTRIAYSGFAEVKPGTPGSRPLSGSITGAVRNSVYITDATNGKILYTFTGLPNVINQIVWSPDDSQLLAVVGAKQVYIWDTNSGELIDTYETVGGLTGVDFSPFGGQVMMGFNLYWYDASTGDTLTPQSVFTRSFLGGAIQVAVPSPSVEKLKAITEECGLQPNIEQSLSSQIASNKLQSFATQVSAFTDAQTPPGCKADLLAVANALMAQPQ